MHWTWDQDDRMLSESYSHDSTGDGALTREDLTLYDWACEEQTRGK